MFPLCFRRAERRNPVFSWICRVFVMFPERKCHATFLSHFSSWISAVVCFRYVSSHGNESCYAICAPHVIAGFHMTSLNFKLQNYWSSWDFQTNFHSEWVLGLVIDYAWISKLLCDVAFAWRARELLCWFKRWLISGNSAIWSVLVFEESIIVAFLSSSRDKFTLL